jgi:hypothetical protein
MVGSKIAEALAKFQRMAPIVANNATNNRLGYRYAKLDEYVNAIRQALSICELAVMATVEQVVELPPRRDQNACRVQIRMTLVHISGESVESLVWGEGQDHGDKAVYKAITGARKYGLACLLNLATADDPERDESVDEPVAPAAPSPVVSSAAKQRPQAKVEKTDEKNNSTLVVKRSAAIQHFAFDDITQADLELWLGKPAKEWTAEDLVRLGAKKDDTDAFRKEVNRMKGKTNAA